MQGRKEERKVLLTPPGDVRPAFTGDIKRIMHVCKEQFGDHVTEQFRVLIEDQIIFLNKVPYIDRMDEIIIQGHIAGIFRFNILKGDYEFSEI